MVNLSYKSRLRELGAFFAGPLWDSKLKKLGIYSLYCQRQHGNAHKPLKG